MDDLVCYVHFGTMWFEHEYWCSAEYVKNWTTVVASNQGAPMDRRPREKEMADAGNGFCVPKAFAKEKGGVVGGANELFL